MVYKTKNNVKSLVADNPLSAVATTLNVTTGTGNRFPNEFPFVLTIWDAVVYSNPGDDPNMEISECSDRTVDAMTIVRGLEGTGGVEHACGSRVAMLLTAGIINSIVPQSNLSASSAPTVNDDSDDGYGVGSEWIDEVADKGYLCLDATVGAAVWKETTQSGGGDGEANTASNLGAGAGLFTTKDGVNLPFKSLTAGTNVTLNENTNDIEIVASGGSGQAIVASTLIVAATAGNGCKDPLRADDQCDGTADQSEINTAITGLPV